MATTLYDDAPLDVRADIRAAHAQRLDEIASPGTWFDAKTRVAIAAEARNAKGCKLCADRKAALSPFAVDGTHDSLGEQPQTIVEVIHRIATDPGRLTQRWYRNCLESGLTEEEYVEIVGVTCSTISLDTFARAAGTGRLPLPAPKAGEPSRERPAEAKPGDAWVPWVAAQDAGERWGDQFGPAASNIRRALSLVPDEARAWFDVVDTQYLNAEQMRDFDTMHRAIDRAQIELVAGRISFLNQCAY